MSTTKLQRLSKILNWVAGKLGKAASQCEQSGKSLGSARGLGDVIATGTQATRIDKFAEWLATDVLGYEGCGCPARRNRINTLWPFNNPKLIIAIPEYNDRGGLWGMLQHLYWEIRQYGLQDHVEVMVVTQTPVIQAPERHIDKFGTPQQKELPPLPTKIIAGPEPLKVLCESMSKRGVKFHYREFTDVIGTGPAKSACIGFARQAGAEWVWVCDSHLHFSPGSIWRFYKWVCKTKNRNSKHLYHCPLIWDGFDGAFTHLETRKPNKLALIGGDNLWGQFRSEIKLLGEDSEAMPISAHGGFWFATRTDVPFGHPLFKGFGDPETIIHEQRRALGHQVYSLPARIVSCVHRFLVVRHNDYHSLMPETAVRNHWIGVQSLRVHLMKESVSAGFQEPTEWLLAAWIEAFPHLKDRILRAAADAATEYYQWEEEQRDARAKAQTRKASMDAVQAQYQKAASTASDINQHLPTLKRLAEGAQHVVEFGVRSGESTKAFLAAGVKRLSSYDITPGSAAGVVSADGQAWDRHFGPEIGDSLKVDIDECDGIFIDTLHTADQVHAELSRHSQKVKSFIALHDTEAPFGSMCQTGENKGGVNAGINRFLADDPYWHIAERFVNNHGMIILRRKAIDASVKS